MVALLSGTRNHRQSAAKRQESLTVRELPAPPGEEVYPKSVGDGVGSTSGKLLFDDHVNTGTWIYSPPERTDFNGIDSRRFFA